MIDALFLCNDYLIEVSADGAVGDFLISESGQNLRFNLTVFLFYLNTYTIRLNLKCF